MLIVCPSCASSYSLTAEQLGAGRKLRCAACRHQWLATPEDALPEPGDGPVPVVAAATEPAPEIAAEVLSHREDMGQEPIVAAEPAPVKTKKPPRARRAPFPRAQLKQRLAALATRIRRVPPAAAAVIALVVLAGLAVAQRKAIVRVMPQTARLFAAIGLPVNLRGLTIEGVKSELVADAAQTILVVEGTVRAVASGNVEVPPLQLSIRGADGQEVYSWTAEAGNSALRQGETAPFRARLVAPPAEGRDVVIRFAGRESHPAAH
ncbi:zinc-ribbon domain-containing protein [uncultured Alsobacter sp.]|uniref:zinc-ribbon domain-containing protein n=1 Tax=uncultured Alsobacter sp. TaxID=1748258 RepID=UPI0025CC111C|nr:zinc-ribbon domain-containing protein [uncultured Alsobacter sp.]